MGSLGGEQFWGRAVRASRHSKEYGTLLIFGLGFEFGRGSYPVSEGSLSADPSRKIVPTTKLYAAVISVRVRSA